MGQSPKGTNVHNEFKINSIEFHQGKTYFSKFMLKESNKWTTQITKCITPPSIIMSVRAPVGNVNMLIGRNIVIGRGLASIKPYLSNIYLFYYFLSIMKNQLEQKSTGTTFKAINNNTLQNILLSLPPLEEQKRIVYKIQDIKQALEKIDCWFKINPNGYQY